MLSFKKCETDVWATIQCVFCHVNGKKRIELTTLDIRPIKSVPYCTGPKARKFEWTEIDKMLGINVIDFSQSEWASRIVFAAKKDGSSRSCIDYRKPNAVTVKDGYPVSGMDESSNILVKLCIF